MRGVFILLILFASTAFARQARLEDAAFAFNERTMDFEVHKDGTYEYVYTEEIEVLKEGHKQDIGTRRIPYNSRSSTLTDVKAEVINAEKHQAVDSKYIEDKTLSSSEQGFDDFNQLIVAYPDVRQGSKLFLRFRMRVNEIPFAGHFSDRVFFGAGFLQRAGKVHIRSALPILIEKNDADGVLEIHQKQNGSVQDTLIELKKTTYTDEVNEYKPRFRFEDMVWVTLSTNADYADLVRKISPRYEEVLGAGLPATYKAIAEAASKERKPVDQVNRVTALLAEKIRYTGDWRPIRGGHIPRPLEMIARTGFGDCKDFSASISAILRSLGFEADVAWVERELKPNSYPKLALQTAFNHAIVWARKGAEVFWVDGTNLQSFAQGVFEDINERPALVIDAKYPRWEKISGGDERQALTYEKRRVESLKDGVSRISSEIFLKGRAAVQITGAGLRESSDVLSYRFATMLSRESDILSYHVDLDDLNSRITRDRVFHVLIDERRSSSLTSAGPIYRLAPREEVVDLLTIDRKDRVSGFFIGHPKTAHRDITLMGVELVGTVPPACKIESPWMKLTRKFTVTGKSIRIDEEVRFQCLMLTAEEIRGADFAKLQSDLKRCFDLAGVIYRIRG